MGGQNCRKLEGGGGIVKSQRGHGPHQPPCLCLWLWGDFGGGVFR